MFSQKSSCIEKTGWRYFSGSSRKISVENNEKEQTWKIRIYNIQSQAKKGVDNFEAISVYVYESRRNFFLNVGCPREIFDKIFGIFSR